MSWIQVSFELETEDPASFADALLESGALSVDLTDAEAGTADERPLFGEPGADALLWRKQKVRALFGEGCKAAERVERTLAELGLVAASAIAHEVISEQDWVRATQAQFAPVQVGERLWIVPSWCEAPDPHAINLRIDPGLAFGTGSHPTTWQCLDWLQSNLRPAASVLDYGCGSGILALAAKKLGAGQVVAVDIDRAAVQATRANARINHVELAALLPDAVPDRQYDVVLANILSNPLKVLAPLLARFVAPNGWIVLGGILSSQADAVSNCYGDWFDMTPWSQKEGWVCSVGRRKLHV
ncbi:MAG TPA: 50S ribosomal protein L11 methyltransferase [Burkholderiales bacterium]|nr:50S ribosomal protein L11 methyltransferase [Burkholderiales bacterium]